MKKKLMIILAIVSIIGLAIPAMAGDWVAALEKEILETQNVEQAMMNAEKTGADKEDILLAAVSILESHDLGLVPCDLCIICNCFTSSPIGAGCNEANCTWCDLECT